MSLIRVPYPRDPERRRAVFGRVAGLLKQHGTYEGTPDRGVFQGATPIGKFAGSYRALDQSGELEIQLTRKPLLVSTNHVEGELRKLLA